MQTWRQKLNSCGPVVKEHTMSYDAKCAQVILQLVECITNVLEDHSTDLDEWLSNGEAITDFGELYKDVFTEVFGIDLLAEELLDRIYFFGMNLAVTLQAGRCIAGDIDSLQKLGSAFIIHQMDILHIWCDELAKGDAYGEF